MPTDWDGNFKKLFERCSSSWLRLPAWVRGYGDELLRCADRRTGRVCDTTEAGDVALVIHAHPDEHEQLGKAIERLVGQGFLVVREGALFVDNIKPATESYEAVRKRNQRERQRAANGSNVPDSPVCPPSVPLEERRGEKKFNPLNPPQAGDENDSKSRSRKRRTALPLDWLPTPAHRSLAKSLGLDCDAAAEHFRAAASARGRHLSDWDNGFKAWLLGRAALKNEPPGAREHRLASTADSEARKRHRQNLVRDAANGRFGPEAQARAKSRERLRELADELELREPFPIRLVTAAGES